MLPSLKKSVFFFKSQIEMGRRRHPHRPNHQWIHQRSTSEDFIPSGIIYRCWNMLTLHFPWSDDSFESERKPIDSVPERHKHCCHYWIWEQLITRIERGKKEMSRNAVKKTWLCSVASSLPTAKANTALGIDDGYWFFRQRYNAENSAHVQHSRFILDDLEEKCGESYQHIQPRGGLRHLHS